MSMQKNKPARKKGIRIIRITAKITLYTMLVFVLLFVAIIGIIQIPSVQSRIRSKVVSSLADKWHTKVSVGSIHLNLRGNVVINDIYIATPQNDTLLSAIKIAVGINPVGLFHKQLLVNRVFISGVNFVYQVQDTAHTNIDFITTSFKDSVNSKKPDTTKSAWVINLRKIELEHIRVRYDNLADSSQINVRFEELAVSFTNTDLPNTRFGISSLSIMHTVIDQNNYAYGTHPAKKASAPEKPSSLSMTIKEMNVKDLSFRQNTLYSMATYSVGETKINAGSVDALHKRISIGKFIITNGSVRLRQEAVTDSKPLTKPDTVQTPGWQVKLAKAELGFDQLYMGNLDEKADVEKFSKTISLKDAVIQVSDLEFISATQWKGNLHKLQFTDTRTRQRTSVSAEAIMKNGQLTASHFEVNSGTSFIKGSGKFVMPAINAHQKFPDFDMTIDASSIRKADVLLYMPAKMQGSFAYVPGVFSYAGRTTSLHGELNTKGNLISDKGNLLLTAQFFPASDIKYSKYKLELSIHDLDAGYFLRNPDLGKVSGLIRASGDGLSLNAKKAQAQVYFSSIGYKKHDFKDIVLGGTLVNGLLDAGLDSKDSLLTADIHVSGNTGSNKNFYVSSKLSRINGKAIGLSQSDTMAISSLLKAHINIEDKRHLSITADTFSITFHLPVKDITSYNKVAYTVKNDAVNANVSTTFADISYAGNVPLQEIPAVLKDYFSQYTSTDSVRTSKDSAANFKLGVKFKDISVFNSISPIKMSLSDAATIHVDYRQNKLNAGFDIQQLSMKDMVVDEVELAAESGNSGFQISVNIAAVRNKTNTLTDLSLTSSLRKGLMESRLSFSNDNEQKWFSLGMTMEPRKPEKNIRLKMPLILNHQNWNVDKENLITFTNGGMRIQNLVLSNKQKHISLLSAPDNPDKLTMELRNLDLSFVSEIMKGDTTSLVGKINGDVSVTNLFAKKKEKLFDADIRLNDIKAIQQPLGDMRIKVSNMENSKVANVNVNLGMTKTEFSLRGMIGMQDKTLNLTFNANNLNLVMLEPFMSNVMTQTSGNIMSTIQISGTTEAPQLNGYIGFDKLSAFIVPVQTRFKLDNQRISFTGEHITFSNFTVNDESGNPLAVNGDVSFVNKEIKSNLQITSKSFLAYKGNPGSMPGEDNRVIVTSDMQLATTANNAPTLKADIQIDEDSKFFYKITRRASTLTEEGVVEFVGAKPPVKANKTSGSSMKNLMITANLTVSDNTPITIITDPASNTGLTMKAGGIFTLVQRPNQDPRLVGKLQVSSGDYTLNLSGLKRKLQIADSSTIAWYGDISKPELNLRVYYQVRTSPADLLGEESSDNGTLPFLVNINITGELAAPNLSFQISLPAEYEGVNNGLVAAKLQEINSNESDVNQKAMALLLFGRFDFSNLAGVFSSNSRSTNAIIASAINQFAAQKLKFVDLHFDLESFNNYGENIGENERTQLSVSASRKFNNNRLSTQLGFMFVLQGDELEQRKPWWEKTSPEFNVSYKINRSRSLSVQAFRKSEYKGLVEGKVINNGVGIVFQKDFDRIGDLFKREDETLPWLTQKSNK